MYIVNESGSATCRGTVTESSDLEVCKDMQHIDLPHLCNSSLSDGKIITWYDLSLIFLRCFLHSKREYSGLYDR